MSSRCVPRSMARWCARLLVLAMTVSMQTAGSEPRHIEVVGLFRNTAVLLIGEQQTVLRVGESTGDGVRLISATSEQAVLEVDGELRTLPLSRMVGSEFRKAEKSTISISPNAAGQYMTGGTINGLPVTLLVDTGASVVAMSEAHAKALGLDYEDAERVDATTASGVASTWRIRLDSVQVGDIRVTDVQAAVLAGDHPPIILLGMSFLERVELTNTGSILMLTSKL